MRQFFANATMAPKLFGSNEMSGVFWTLFIEILFYACCTILFKFKCLDKAYVIGLIAVGLNLTTPLAIIHNKFFHLHVPVQFILFHLSFLFAGNLLRLTFGRSDRVAGYFITAFILICMFTVPLTSGLIFQVKEATDKGFVMFTPEAVVYAYLLAACLFVFAVHYKSFSNRVMVNIGRMSYSLYLLHMLCFVLVTKFISPDTISGFFTYLIVSAFLSYAVANFALHFIEYAAIEYGKKIIKLRGYV